jgi:hypothetical protein
MIVNQQLALAKRDEDPSPQYGDVIIPEIVTLRRVVPTDGKLLVELVRDASS